MPLLQRSGLRQPYAPRAHLSGYRRTTRHAAAGSKGAHQLSLQRAEGPPQLGRSSTTQTHTLTYPLPPLNTIFSVSPAPHARALPPPIRIGLDRQETSVGFGGKTCHRRATVGDLRARASFSHSILSVGGRHGRKHPGTRQTSGGSSKNRVFSVSNRKQFVTG